MKRILALCIALLLIFAFASCTDKKKDDGANDSAKNYYITYNGQKIEVGADAQKVISKLGKYTSEDGEACGTDEKDVIYTLSGMEIETHVNKDGEVIRKIEILNDSQKTEKGITIGSTRDEVIKAYGKNYTEDKAIEHWHRYGNKVPGNPKTMRFIETVFTDLSAHGEKYILNKRYMKSTFKRICIDEN